ncbi:hypothetical protein ACIQU4_28195 [Streptomyces sp. NPDC090741]|uniref:hypothetical protein n=1 Tax=Streptomyces sp. NPDC090741 TaxID=3365967 RepID=UPI00382D568E
MNQTTNKATETIDAIKARMAEIRDESSRARAKGDTRAEFALDGELANLGQRLRNLRPTPDYGDDRCCATCP